MEAFWYRFWEPLLAPLLVALAAAYFEYWLNRKGKK